MSSNRLRRCSDSSSIDSRGNSSGEEWLPNDDDIQQVEREEAEDLSQLSTVWSSSEEGSESEEEEEGVEEIVWEEEEEEDPEEESDDVSEEEETLQAAGEPEKDEKKLENKKVGGSEEKKTPELICLTPEYPSMKAVRKRRKSEDARAFLANLPVFKRRRLTKKFLEVEEEEGEEEPQV
ncbi:MAG TPA: hypothetical protein VIY47_03515 [Ignavibacteriaceae bacterium]